MNAPQIITCFLFCLIASCTLAVAPTFAQDRLLVDFTTIDNVQEALAFEGLGTLSDNGYEITLPATTDDNFGIVYGMPFPEGVIIDQNTQLLIEATVGPLNDTDFVVAVRETDDGASGEFFAIIVPAEDFADDGRATVTLRDFFFNGDITDGIPNGVVTNIALQSTFESGNAVDFTLQRISAVNGSASILGDCNRNGVVDFNDIPSFIAILVSGGFLPEADCNQDGVVDFEDIAAFITILQAQ